MKADSGLTESTNKTNEPVLRQILIEVVEVNQDPVMVGSKDHNMIGMISKDNNLIGMTEWMDNKNKEEIGTRKDKINKGKQIKARAGKNQEAIIISSVPVVQLQLLLGHQGLQDRPTHLHLRGRAGPKEEEVVEVVDIRITMTDPREGDKDKIRGQMKVGEMRCESRIFDQELSSFIQFIKR